MKTAVAYCRYSTDLQKQTSIEDQIALCEQIAAREGLRIVKVYTDRAKTSATMIDRDGLLALMRAAQHRGFHAVISESPDRLSRDAEDLAGIFKRLKFAEIDIYDLKGEVTDIDIGVRGITGPPFMKDLAAKIRRGINGRVRKGLVPGVRTYGYRLVAGKPGEREINPDEAKIIRRIFQEYVDGKPPRQIALDLTRDGIPTPRGNAEWNHNTIAARSKERGGMIGCQLYIGKLVWNVNRSILNPHTGRKIQRKSKPDDVMVTDVPHLRIIDQELWDRAHKVQDNRSGQWVHQKPPRAKTNCQTTQTHLLGGLLFCEKCGQHMIVMQTSAKDARVACSAANLRTTCEHKRSYSLRELERTVLDGMKDKLTNTTALIEFTKAYHARWAERQKAVRSERDKVQRNLNKTTVQIDRYVTAIGESDEPVKGLVDKIKALEAERIALEGRLALIDGETGGAENVVSLHPAALDRFRDNVMVIHNALTGDVEGEKAAPFRAAFRNLFERVVVHETRPMQRYEVTPYARLSAILGVELFQKGRTVEEMLAEQGVNAGLIPETQDSQFCQTGLY
jgi:DNA invertase Pin-like site-specific DNA recombinase